MSGALAFRPDKSEAALLFQIKEGAYNTDSLSTSCTTCTSTSARPKSP